MSSSAEEEARKYHIENEQEVHGQTVGDGNTIHQYFGSVTQATSPVPPDMEEKKGESIRHVLSICNRRALFIQCDDELSVRVMWASLSSCRVELQKMVVFVSPKEIHKMVVEIICDLDAIEREQARPSLEMFQRIDTIKVRIMKRLVKLSRAGNIPYLLPKALIQGRIRDRVKADEPLNLS